MSFDNPKVFGDGVLTICVGTRGCTVYVGSQEIELVDNIQFEMGTDGVPQIFIKLPKSYDNHIKLKLEEQIRTLKTIPWIKIQK